MKKLFLPSIQRKNNCMKNWIDSSNSKRNQNHTKMRLNNLIIKNRAYWKILSSCKMK